MWVELTLPEEVAEALPPSEGNYRGPSDVSVAIEVVDTVSSLVTVAQVVAAAPDLARRIRTWLQSRAGHAGTRAKETPRLVVKAPGVHVEIELPPNTPTQRIVTTIIEALQAEHAGDLANPEG